MPLAGPVPNSASQGGLSACCRQARVRRKFLGRLLIVNAAHLRKVVTEYEDHLNAYRPHRALIQASPLRALPDPVDADIKVIRRDRLGGLIREYAQVAYGG
jgi:putative transposase